jgi:hypothetical protein
MFRNWKVESMRKLLLALFGAVLGLGALATAPAPAQAQGFSVTIGGPGYYPPRPIYRPAPPRPVYYRPAPEYRPYRRHDYRPAYYGQRCESRIHRYWDGYGWVRERRRHCW